MTTSTPAAGYDQGFVDLVNTFDALDKPRVDPETLGNAAGILMAAAGALDDACSWLWDGLDSLTVGAMAGWQGQAATTFATSLTDHLTSLRRTAAALESAGGRMLDAAGAARELQIALLRAGDVFSDIGAAKGVSLDEGAWLFSSARDAVGNYVDVLAGCVRVWRTLADHAPALPPAPDHSFLGELGGLKDRAVGAVTHPFDTEGHILASEVAATKDLVVATFNSFRANPTSPLFAASLLGDPRGTIDNCFDQLRGSVNIALHPDLAIQAIIDSPDLQAGDFGAWLGRLAPSVAFSVATGGLGAAEVDAVAIQTRVGTVAADGALFSREAATSNAGVVMSGAGLSRTAATVADIASRAGVDLSASTVRIIEDPEYLRYLDSQGACACAPYDLPGEIHLGPASFLDEQTLAATLAHEQEHLLQYEAGYVPGSGDLEAMEAAARAAEGPAVDKMFGALP